MSQGARCIQQKGKKMKFCPKTLFLNPEKFTFFELLESASHHCWDFFKRFICTDQYGCVRKHTESAALRGCEVAKLALCGEDVKTAAVPPCEVPLTGCGYVNGCVLGQTSKFAQSQNTPLFFESERGFGGKRKPSFLVKRSFPLPQEPSTLIGNSAFSND